jgi:hypothetical protein
MMSTDSLLGLDLRNDDVRLIETWLSFPVPKESLPV